MTFEQAMDRLEEILSTMEDATLSLEQALALYEEGVKLTAMCSDMLKKAQSRLQEAGEDENDL